MIRHWKTAAAATAVVGALIAAGNPAGAAGSAVRYAYATQHGGTVVVVNDWSRDATITDLDSGNSAVAGPFKQQPAIIPIDVPTSGCVLVYLRVVWADRHGTFIHTEYCAAGAGS
jgi:hypothetical protein